jgi:hypothetical protein
MPLTIKDVGVDEEKLREILVDLAYWSYHNTVLEEYGDTDKKIELALSLIKDLPCKIELDEEAMAEIIINEMLPFADKEWRKDYPDDFKFDEQTIKNFGKILTRAIKSKQEEIIKKC